jgi:hypothetical protein
MRFFASWWERFPGRVVAPTVLMALAIVGLLGNNLDAFIKAFLGPYGFVWG